MYTLDTGKAPWAKLSFITYLALPPRIPCTASLVGTPRIVGYYSTVNFEGHELLYCTRTCSPGTVQILNYCLFTHQSKRLTYRLRPSQPLCHTPVWLANVSSLPSSLPPRSLVVPSILYSLSLYSYIPSVSHRYSRKLPVNFPLVLTARLFNKGVS